MKKNAFTMIELVFVIVVLGILAAVAVPRFAATRDDAQIAKGRADVASIRAGIINERQTRLFRGNPAFAASLDAGGTFGNVMTYPVTPQAGDGHWQVVTAGTVYTYTVLGAANTFTYTPADGRFMCTAGAQCGALTD